MPVFDSRADVIYIGKNLLPVEKEYLKELPYVSSPSEEADYLIFEKEDIREEFRTWEELKKLYKKYNIVVKSIGQLKLAKNLKEISWNTYTFEEKEKLERWTKISIDEVIKKDYSLDLGLIKDESLLDIEALPNPILNTNETIEKLEEAIDLLKLVVNELKNCGLSEED